MAVRTMYVTDIYENELTGYMPTAFAPSDATTAASIVDRADSSPRRTAKCTNAKDAMPMPTRPPPRARSKWRMNDVVAAGTSAVPRKRLRISNSARIVRSLTPPSAIADAMTYRMRKPGRRIGPRNHRSNSSRNGDIQLRRRQPAVAAAERRTSPRGRRHAATPRARSRGFSRPRYAQIRPWRSLLNGSR